MKNKLESAREEINKIDKEMVDLFKKRMKAVEGVVEYKIENNMPVLDSSREKDLINKNLSLLNDKNLEEYYKTFFEGVLTSSKDYQKDILNKETKVKKYALLGEHLSHSCSPLIHNEIFKSYGINASYEKIECSKEELEAIINKLRTGEYQGYNVTIPYKLEVMKYLDEISDEAKAIGSVNTIAYVNGKVVGYNTDYFGFYNEIKHYNIDVENKNCYILGTGGASLALHKALVDLKANVKYVSRSPKNDMTISYEELKNANIDLIVNATPVGMYPNIDGCPISEDTIKKAKYVMDIIFNPRQTKLLKYANSNMDGLFMLVGQAIAAEEIWQGKKYPSSIVDLVKKVEVEI